MQLINNNIMKTCDNSAYYHVNRQSIIIDKYIVTDTFLENASAEGVKNINLF